MIRTTKWWWYFFMTGLSMTFQDHRYLNVTWNPTWGRTNLILSVHDLHHETFFTLSALFQFSTTPSRFWQNKYLFLLTMWIIILAFVYPLWNLISLAPALERHCILQNFLFLSQKENTFCPWHLWKFNYLFKALSRFC